MDAGPSEDAAVVMGSARVVAAFEQSCIVNERGLYCWGLNVSGQVGIGSRDPMTVGLPERIDAGAEYVEICTAEYHTCGLRRGGVLDCWGANSKGQLGLGDYAGRDAPTSLGDAPRFASVACGGEISCGLTDDGALYCWGANNEGALGQGEQGAVGQASATPLLVPLAQPARQVSVGQGHVCAIDQNDALFCWGRDSQFQLGVPPPPPGMEQVRTPTQVVGGGSYRQVAAGQAYTCAVRKEGQLYCWGTDAYFDGRLGLGTTLVEVREPTQVGADDDYLEVHATWFHTCALRAQGRLFCWGRNDEGQLGQGDLMVRYEPVPVDSGGQAWQEFTVGRFHTCGLRSGDLYCWGKNENFQQLGLGDTQRRNVPTLVPIP
jgi:alpha-tubulin suppressor-like RCC1 family protein